MDPATKLETSTAAPNRPCSSGKGLPSVPVHQHVLHLTEAVSAPVKHRQRPIPAVTLDCIPWGNPCVSTAILDSDTFLPARLPLIDTHCDSHSGRYVEVNR